MRARPATVAMLTATDGRAAEAPDPVGAPAEAPPDAFCVTGTSIGPPELSAASIVDRALASTLLSASDRMLTPGSGGTTAVAAAVGWKRCRRALIAAPSVEAAGASDHTPGAVTARLLEFWTVAICAAPDVVIARATCAVATWCDLVTATSEPLLDAAALCVASTLRAPPILVASPPPRRADVLLSESVTDQPLPDVEEARDVVVSAEPDDSDKSWARVTPAPSATDAAVVVASLANATAAPDGAVASAV